MARSKEESMSRYHKRRLRSPAAYAMGLIPFHARLAERAPRLANFATRTPEVSRVVKRVGGISPERQVPAFAHESFRVWFSKRAAVNPNGPPVVLFADTFSNFLHPEPIKAAVDVLE